jgi:hypothetical protein
MLAVVCQLGDLLLLTRSFVARSVANRDEPAMKAKQFLGLFALLPRETVWKLRKGSDSWSHEPAERDQRAPFRAFRATKNRAMRPAQRVSRQSLEGVFSEVRQE